MMKVKMMKRRVIEPWRFLEAMESGALKQRGKGNSENLSEFSRRCFVFVILFFIRYGKALSVTYAR